MKCILLSLVLYSLCLLPAGAQPPRVFLSDANRWQQLKQRYTDGDATVRNLLHPLLSEADKALTVTPHSVMEKSFDPPSGNKHDYMSMAPYFWPDSTKPGGKPYIRKDGQRNPEINKITDKAYMGSMVQNTRSLAIAFYFTGAEKYAAKAAQLLQVWFLDSSTYMHPHLNYAQAVPGINDGRGIGIIETVSLANLTDILGLLANSPAYTAIELGIQKWFAQYLDWMLTSKNGTDEHHALNNHGTWYDMQVLSFSLFLGRTDFARQYVSASLKRIPVQIEPDGRQPKELERTTALGYSTFNLEAWFKLATLAAHVQADVWHYQAAGGQSIRKAFDWLLPYALGHRPWPYQQIHAYSKYQFYYLLLQAGNHFHNGQQYYQQAAALKNTDSNTLTELLYGNI